MYVHIVYRMMFW